MKKAIIAIGVIVIVGLFVVLNLRKEGSRTDVQVSEVKLRTITKLITASGSIKAKRQVNVSASAIGKVTKLAVSEGDHVDKGDFLLQIDPTSYQSVVDQLRALLRGAGATLEMERANLAKAELDLERAITLHEKNVISEEELRTARLNADLGRAKVKAAKESISQHNANLNKASHDLSEVQITADIAGIITMLNVEEGENAIMGTLNNPGTILLTIADLSEIEAEIEVDETEVIHISVGQDVDVALDAYPDSSFAGVVTEVGNSAIRSQIGLGQSSVDFKVVVSIHDVIPNVRPGLSANAKIKVARVEDAVSIPIQCLTVRKTSELQSAKKQPSEETSDSSQESDDDEDPQEKEGVFVVADGTATFRPVVVGIAGSAFFEVTSGLETGEKVVSGPFKAISTLTDGDPVKIEKKAGSGAP